MSTVKRRQRTSRACAFCKRRKIKCDMKQPCSSCVKFGCPKCVYILYTDKDKDTIQQADKIHKEITALEDRISHLKMSLSDKGTKSDESKDVVSPSLQVGNSYTSEYNVLSDKRNVISLHDGYINEDKYSYRLTGKGPLSWLSLMKLDYNLNKALIIMTENGELQKIQQKIEENNKNLFDLEYNIHSFDQDDSVEPKQINEASSLKLAIINYLPDGTVLSLLVDRFFSHIFSGMPIVDEREFKRQAAEVINYRAYYTSCPNPSNIPAPSLDLAFLGILLVSMRFAYLSLFSIPGKIHDYGDFRGRQDIAKLFSYPISVEAIKLAKCCLDQFDLTKVSRLDVFQLALILRYYKHFCPEEGDGADSGDYSMLTSRLFDIAYSLGLERDPNHGVCEDENEKDLRRALWFVLVLIDKTDAMTTGAPLNCVKFTFDTKLPRIMSHGNEQKSENSFETYAYFDYLFQIVRLTTDVRGVDIKELLSKISDWEEEFLDYASISTAILVPPHKDQFFLNGLRYRIYLNGAAFLISLYFHVYTFYERKGNVYLSGKFFEKLILKIKDVMLCCYDLVDKNEQIFKGSTDLLVVPSLLSSIHKSLVVLCAFISRINSLVLLDGTVGNSNATESIQRFQELLKNCYMLLMRVTRIFNGGYFYASVIVSLQQRLWTKINAFEFNETFSYDRLFGTGIPLEKIGVLSAEILIALKKIEDQQQLLSLILEDPQNLEEEDIQDWNAPEEVDFNKIECFDNWNLSTNEYTDTQLGQFDLVFEDLLTDEKAIEVTNYDDSFGRI